jgi:hypothetical protein
MSQLAVTPTEESLVVTALYEFLNAKLGLAF